MNIWVICPWNKYGKKAQCDLFEAIESKGGWWDKDQYQYKCSLSRPNRVSWMSGPYSIVLHSRFLVPDNTQKILTEIWHHFWIKNDGEKWSRKIISKFHDGLQSCCCPVQKNLPRKDELAWQVGRYHWRPPLNFKIFFSKPLFTVILSQKWCQISVRIFCVLPGTKNLQ